ncbi:putative rhomboid-family protein (Ventrhoid transmembrane protein) [Desulfamplus magnetovallimortis]|uniref:Putative rhomboid-family protein (Ventrhoid transmembrane protein) n=1 Tax=Desulfamplus magnetovallimortis TaxID=1246637 RepID=A0A1W1HCD8_9BACT|nr:rhomboid family intramembrane serine protease [Desulfamplus magnetovallimortis]SLM30045.1 putative rhomboid-family protein (Ventrhoid transmembrane protein) [Desulfamplus magnetovallimortis]
MTTYEKPTCTACCHYKKHYNNEYLFFCLTLLLSGKSIHFSLNPLTALSPSTNALVFMGASGTVPINQYHQWWSLITANWLHGSLMHIIFNMIALSQTGYMIIAIFGIHRMIIIYTLTGVAGFYLSYLAGVPITIGASASICGLIGAAFYYGRSGGKFSKAVFNTISGWIISLVIFGIAIQNINNWGHGGGFVSGIILAWLLGYHESKPENIIHKTLSSTCFAVTLSILGWAIISAILTFF